MVLKFEDMLQRNIHHIAKQHEIDNSEFNTRLHVIRSIQSRDHRVFVDIFTGLTTTPPCDIIYIQENVKSRISLYFG
jgi:hypothetical protein